MRTAFESEGDIRGTDLLAALVALWREGASGTLQFSRSGASGGFEISAGEIVATTSSDPRFETASILVRAGKLEAATLERLAAPAGADRAVLALQAGVLTRREWRWGEKIRAVEVLSELLTWLEGEYSLSRTAAREPGDFHLPIPRLILELFLRSRDRSLVLHYLGGVDVPLARAERFDAEFSTFGLTADAESVVRLIDGNATAAEIASEAPAEPLAVEKLLAALVTLGLIHPEFAPAEQPAAGPRREAEANEEEEQETAEVTQEETEETTEEPAGLHEQESAGEAELEEAHVGVSEEEKAAAAQTDREPRVVESLEMPVAAGQAANLEEAALYSPEPEVEDSSYGGPGDFGQEPGAEPALDRPFDTSTGVGGDRRPRRRSASALVWVLVVLAASAGAVLWYRSRGPSGAQTGLAPGLRPTEAAVLEPTARPAPVQPTAQAATAPTAVSRPSTTAAAPAPVREAGTPDSSRQFWLERASRDQKRLNGDRKTRFAIQLELACEIGSLVDAWRHDRPAGTMWVLTTPFQGRTCFRVLWGRYPTREAARRALPGAPSFFSTARNRPIVTAVR